MIMLYPNLCYNELCYEGTVLYFHREKTQLYLTAEEL